MSNKRKATEPPMFSPVRKYTPRSSESGLDMFMSKFTPEEYADGDKNKGYKTYKHMGYEKYKNDSYEGYKRDGYEGYNNSYYKGYNSPNKGYKGYDYDTNDCNPFNKDNDVHNGHNGHNGHNSYNSYNSYNSGFDADDYRIERYHHSVPSPLDFNYRPSKKMNVHELVHEVDRE